MDAPRSRDREARRPPSRREAASEVRARLEQAVASRRRADVPVGVWLSGGLDSAAIAALARRDGPVPTFTLRPTDRDFDEGDAARATAHALGTEHHEVAVDAAALAAGFDEVFASSTSPSATRRSCRRCSSRARRART